MFNAVFREGGHGVFAVGKLPAGLAGTFDVALAADMALAAVWLVGGRCGSLGSGRPLRAAAEMWEKCGESLTGGGRGRIFRALTRWPAARAAAAVHTERGQRGTGGGAAVGETFTGAGAGAMTYLIFRRLHYGSI